MNLEQLRSKPKRDSTGKIVEGGWNIGRENFFHQLRRRTKILSEKQFVENWKKFNGEGSENEMCPAFAGIFIANSHYDSKSVFDFAGVYVNRDFYDSNPAFIEVVLEHEYYEIYYLTKQGFNVIQASKDNTSFATQLAHRLARIRELEKAKQLGVLDDYIELLLKKKFPIEELEEPYRRVVGEDLPVLPARKQSFLSRFREVIVR